MKLNKLAIGLVAALTLGLTGVAASANTQTLTVATVSATGGTTSATAIALPVPADNVSSSNALSISVSGVANGTTVSATATNALLLSTLTGATAASGSATLTVNASTSGSVELFVFTKTTAVGSVVVTVGNTQTTYYVKGTAGDLAKVALAAPATGLAGSTQSVVVSAFDKYNNAKSGGTVNLVINTNGVITTATATTTTSGTVSHVVTLPATGNVTVTAFAASSSAVATIAVNQPRNIEAELGAALAAVATLTADLATANTAKADLEKVVRKLKWQYNVLVKKYNVGKPKAQKLAFIK
jgi:hypothetical protein